MYRHEFNEIVSRVNEVDRFEANVKGFLSRAEKDLEFIQDQDRRNEVVNKIASVLREEFGSLNEEVAKTLERLRVVSDRTIQRDKQKEREKKQQ